MSENVNAFEIKCNKSKWKLLNVKVGQPKQKNLFASKIQLYSFELFIVILNFLWFTYEWVTYTVKNHLR